MGEGANRLTALLPVTDREREAPEERAREIVGEIADIRNQLDRTLAELDRRRHEATDLRLQIRRHPAVAAGVALGILAAASGIVALALITLRMPWTYVLWTVYGLGAAVNVLGFTLLGQGFPRALAARANTALNLLMFSGSFAVQWGIGLVVDAARSRFGIDTGAALQLAFSLVLVVDFLACGWFLFGWRRHAVVTPAVDAGA